MDLRFKLRTLKKYGFDIDKYKLNHKIREFYLQKKCEMGKKRDLEKYFEIISFIDEKDIDFERFYYIYFETAEELYKQKRYDEACRHYQIAIDNVISPSYRKNKSKLKSKHFKLFLKNYCFAVDCFLKAGMFTKADYYDELNMYQKGITKLSDETKAEVYASLGAKEVATKYYLKIIDEIDREVITRQYDYDPYTNGYLEEKYKKEVTDKEARIRRYIHKIDSL